MSSMNTSISSEILSYLKKTSKLFETAIDPLFRKQTGSYYTDLDLTDHMMAELIKTINNSEGSKQLWEYRFLEPCVGTGNFVFSYINNVIKQGITAEQGRQLLNNIYVADINKEALVHYKNSLRIIASYLWEIQLDEDYFKSHVGGGLLFDISLDKPNYIKISDVFPESVIDEGFDIIATNPPYKNLKAEKCHYKNNDDYLIDKNKYSLISSVSKSNFKFTSDGIINLFKLFIEEIIESYSCKDAFISLLVPASILSDKTCYKLRSHILLNTNLTSVEYIKEGNRYIDANQALCTMLLHKGAKTSSVSITKDFLEDPSNSIDVKLKDIINKDSQNSILALNDHEFKTLKQLRQFPTVKELSFITNSRGELDLTINKDQVVTSLTNYKLARGRNIKYYSLNETDGMDYVDSDFVLKSKKRKYIHGDRIACQQISNMKKERRIQFAPIPANIVLGNSCNFIFVQNNIYGIDSYTILGLFNSKVINWFFKLTSSNNHINNYEIDSFPVPVDSNLLGTIGLLVREYIKKPDENKLDQIEENVCCAYNII